MCWFFFLSKKSLWQFFSLCNYFVSFQGAEYRGLALAHFLGPLSVLWWIQFAGSIAGAFINQFLKWVIQFDQSNTLDTIRKMKPLSLHTGVPLFLRTRQLPSGGRLQDPENCLIPLQPAPFHSHTLVRFKPVYKLAKGWTLAVVWGLNVTLKFMCMPDTWWGPASMKDSSIQQTLQLSPGSVAAAPQSLGEALPSMVDPTTQESCVLAAWTCKGNGCTGFPASWVIVCLLFQSITFTGIETVPHASTWDQAGTHPFPCYPSSLLTRILTTTPNVMHWHEGLLWIPIKKALRAHNVVIKIPFCWT